MSWEKSNYTAAGAALLSESLSGGALVITRAVSGTGTADADLSEETGVSGETHDLKLLDIETVESNGETARRVKIQITGADETYIMHQVGVYGRLNDDAETLLFIMQDARGVEVPSTKVNGDFEIELSALLAVSNKANISITVDPQMQALAKLVKAEIEKHNADASAHAATITAAVSAAVKNLSESGEILNEEQVKALIKEQVDGGTGGGYYGSYKLTLAADEWKPARSEDDYENAGGMDYYQCIYDAELSDSTSELVPVGVVSPGSFYTTTKAGVLNGCETHDGFIRFFAQRIPEADIQATVTLFGKGDGSGETGSVSIGQGLKRDASGAIAVRIGEGLDFDSANALTVRKETVMTSEDLLDEEETQQEIVDIYTTSTFGNNNSYKDSSIHTYLNGTFYNLIDSNIRAAIKQVKIPYQNGTGSGGSLATGSNGLSTKVFLLSGYEVGWTTSDNGYFPKDGVRLAYFGNSSSGNSKRIAYNGSSAAIWWLRSPYTSLSNNVWFVSTDGSSYGSWCLDSCGVRPAFILPSTLVVSDDGTVSVNTAPTVSTDGAALGRKNAAFAWKYTVRDADGDTLTVTERLDGKTTKTRTGVASGTALAFEQTASAAGFQKILNGNHTITVEVSDGKETVSTSATFTKAVHAASVTLAEPLAVEGDITVAVLQVTGSIPDDAKFKAEVTNNALDSSPVWQDATTEVKKGVNIVFENKTATNGAAFNFRVSVERGESGEGGYIEAVSGAFQ